MTEESTILLEKKTIDTIKKIKEYPRQTYNEIIMKMANLFISAKENNQYDKFLHKIQQEKMKELWENEKDEEWENA